MELVMKKYEEKGFTTVRGLAMMFGLSYVGMRRVLERKKIMPDMEVKRGTKTYYLFDAEKVIKFLVNAGYAVDQDTERHF